MYRQYDPITYRHPRTTTEAFGCDASNACPVQVFKSSLTSRLWNRNKHWLRPTLRVLKWVLVGNLVILAVVYVNSQV